MKNRTIRKYIEPFIDWVNSSDENNIKDLHIIESFIESRSNNKKKYPVNLNIKCGSCGYSQPSVNKYCFNCLLELI